MNWFNGWLEIKKPTASNSLESLSSKSQSLVFEIISSSSLILSPNKSIWLADLFSKLFFDLVIKLGIELNKEYYDISKERCTNN